MRILAHAILLALISTLGVAAAQEPDADTGAEGKGSPAEQRIAYLRGKMARYQVQASSDSKAVYPLDEKLALRWSNPVSGVVDGGIFVWTAGGRPAVVGKCYLNEEKEAWGEALQSVTTGPLVMTLEGREVWRPAGQGVTFHRLKGPAKPSATDAGRLRQMRTLVRRIGVVGIWGEKEESEWTLRDLPTPVYRYASESQGIVDGAIFAFTQGGTNPEAIALVELIEEDGQQHWQVAVARLTKYGIRATLDGEVIAEFSRSEMPGMEEAFYNHWHWFTRYPFPKQGATTP